MKSQDVREAYLSFFRDRMHAVIPSASLVPENDPTTLFTGSGMQPLVPYLLGQPHPAGKRLTNSQKSFRSQDIEEVGDNRHTTFFEMLGNWSLGDYFKEEQLSWFFEFLTDVVGLDPQRLYVSVFSGDETLGIPKDTEAVALWQRLFAEKGIEATAVDIGSEERGYEVGMQGGRIFAYDAKKNWWSRSGVPSAMPVGEPGGPDSEVFYEFTDIEHDPAYGAHCHPNCDCGRFMEIGNSVFMEYQKNDDGSFSKLPQRNVDFGGGLERIVAASENTPDVFKIDLFEPTITALEQRSGESYVDPTYTASFRIIADHLRSAAFLIGDGVDPSNTDRGYFVRRLLRRATRHADRLGLESVLSVLVGALLAPYTEAYPETLEQAGRIAKEVQQEEEKFRTTLGRGMREFEKLSGSEISGHDAFILFSTYGFPIELIDELAKERGVSVDLAGFRKEMTSHQEKSRAGSEQKFKGGLADHSDQVVRYHTTTHLLHQALREVLGNEVAQKGSNITPERLRFDFAFSRKMTDDEKKRVEEIVNKKITEALPVQSVVLPKAEAEASGALHFFGERYGDSVTVYFIGSDFEHAYSKEFCGGPHVANTKELGTFAITKEEAISAGVRRIRATLT